MNRTTALVIVLSAFAANLAADADQIRGKPGGTPGLIGHWTLASDTSQFGIWSKELTIGETKEAVTIKSDIEEASIPFSGKPATASVRTPQGSLRLLGTAEWTNNQLTVTLSRDDRESIKRVFKLNGNTLTIETNANVQGQEVASKQVYYRKE